MNSYDATNIQWIVHQPLVSAIRPGSWGDNVLMFLALCQFKCPVQRLIMSLTLSQCLNVCHPFLNWAQILPRTTRGQKRAEHCSMNTAFLAQTMLTHQAQSCRTKTNIYLYKHIKLFSSNPYEKGDPAMQQAGPASSTAGRLCPWTCCLQPLWAPALLPRLRGCNFPPGDPTVPGLPSTSFHWSQQPPVRTARLTSSVWTIGRLLYVWLREYDHLRQGREDCVGLRDSLWGAGQCWGRGDRSSLYFAREVFRKKNGNMMFTYFRSNGINFRRCWPSWGDELGRKGSWN